jgi:hypothetical protein
MLTATSMFIESLEKWLRAARADNFEEARVHAANLTRSGELLVVHPEFRRCFMQHYPNVEPKDALLHLCQFFVCATDGRARVLKSWVESNRPVVSLDDSGGPQVL